MIYQNSVWLAAGPPLVLPFYANMVTHGSKKYITKNKNKMVMPCKFSKVNWKSIFRRRIDRKVVLFQSLATLIRQQRLRQPDPPKTSDGDSGSLEAAEMRHSTSDIFNCEKQKPRTAAAASSVCGVLTFHAALHGIFPVSVVFESETSVFCRSERSRLVGDGLVWSGRRTRGPGLSIITQPSHSSRRSIPSSLWKLATTPS